MNEQNKRPEYVRGQRLNRRNTLLKLIKVNLIRVVFIVVCVFLCYQIILIKQEHGNDYEVRAMSQLVSSSIESDQAIRPNRGSVFDRNGNALALSRLVYNVFIDPKILVSLSKDDQENTVNNLSEFFNMDKDELWEYLRTEVDGSPTYNTNYLVIKKKISRTEAQSLNQRIEEKKVRCVYLEDDTERVYPLNTVASQVVGFNRGNISWGLENVYDSKLAGEYGRVFRTYDASGSVVTQRIDAKEGLRLVTTLDVFLQQSAEKICKQYGDLYEAANTEIVIMNPNTGEILAMAQYPTFNLNAPADPEFVNNPKTAEAINANGETDFKVLDRLWTNYVVSRTYEPGSIFKPITVAMALEEGIINENTRFYCGGALEVFPGTKPIRCHLRSGHGDISLDEAMAYSCNVAMMKIAEACGRDIFYDYQRSFGYGSRTGIDLPSETSALYQVHARSALNPLELATSSFGQTFNATSIQNVTAFAPLINGGNLVEPYIVSQMFDHDNILVYNRTPVISRKVISKETSDYIRRSLQRVFTPQATGRKAIIPGYAIGGKTGTAEQGSREVDDEWTLDFMAYLPIENPQYLVFTVVNRPENYNENEMSASPMMKDMLTTIIEYYAIPSSNEGEETTKNSKITLDLIKQPLEDAVRFCIENELEYTIIGGSGSVVTSHFPQAGSKIDKGTKVFLTISEQEGQELVEVPDLTSLSEEEARAVLESMGFVPVFVNVSEPEQARNAEASEGTPETSQLSVLPKGILSQIPEAGFRVPAGTEVKIRINR